MKQYFTDYKNWEDWQNGMWKNPDPDQEIELLNDAVKCLTNPTEAMQRVVDEWKIATRVNLTNKGQNQKSWLGQAACCIEYAVPEKLTRVAWNGLPKEIKDNANRIAKQIIEQWERTYSE